MAMHLTNGFSQEVLQIMKGFNYCWLCGENGSDLGLQIHHIFGRTSDSRLNACCLCYHCHDKITQQPEENKYLLSMSIVFWYRQSYKWNYKDINFIENHKNYIDKNLLNYEL